MVRIGFISVTAAVKARKLLRRGNVPSRITRVDEVMSAKGCTYALEVMDNDFLAAVAALRREGVEYRVIGNDG